MEKEIKGFLEFYNLAVKLKTTTRHCWFPDSGRQESTADHSWMLALFAIVLSPKLQKKIDVLKVMKMVVVHDLAEAITGDIPAHEISKRQESKYELEKKTFKEITKSLSKETADEIISLWEEFEERKTNEAIFANSLDKIEAVMQHNLSDFSTWNQGDFDIHPYYRDSFFDFDPFMRKLKDVVDKESMEKIIQGGQVDKIDKKHIDRYKASN